jgi:hypothetical protein
MPIPQLALAAKAASGILGGLGQLAAGRAARQQARINAYIGETRAMQTESLGSELGTLRATFAANGQGGGAEFFQQLRQMRQRELRVAVGNERQGAADMRRQGDAAYRQGVAGAITSFASAGPSLFEMSDYARGPQFRPMGGR